MRRQLQINSDHLVFVLLVAIAVVGRLGRLDWNFTPLAAVALLAGCYFRNRFVAALVPLTALAITDLTQPSHYSGWVLASVWGCMMVPAMLGPWLRKASSKLQVATRGVTSALLPATIFFLVTNLVVWAVGPVAGSPFQFGSDLAGLATVYAAGIPFYLKMLAGDLFYVTTLFGAFAIATGGFRAWNETAQGAG
ncbi:DUF6580 family putative transport protein [Aeoliella mucimassa]|uniref:Uncharacterized protein n=1 Tax=Aeoliella mucimassa TaxID=2527972 RepID=A0A518AVP0_9BACT|nr:DUF6580 family putative transport protein [Aeoliella mucimassa]QDU58773.1 hypothetical protein Pan181_50130 [Aeoliella mucimassa]